MTDQEAILRTIIADPANDYNRLVFADFVEENGDAIHAELIRCDIQLRKTPRYKPRNLTGNWASTVMVEAALGHRNEDDNQLWCPLNDRINELERLHRADHFGRGLSISFRRLQLQGGAVPGSLVRGLYLELSCDWLWFEQAIILNHPIQAIRLVDWNDVPCEAESFRERFPFLRKISIAINRGSTGRAGLFALCRENGLDLEISGTDMRIEDLLGPPALMNVIQETTGGLPEVPAFPLRQVTPTEDL